ncbi:hypothetical protein XENORESO_011581 [Xenotaenia resolanae]|uniref:Uncharacterized protein n=1 Tax=Xenotaenia resolanae TaxID=208358 RepID=A0ABV0W9Q1_9TELE
MSLFILTLSLIWMYYPLSLCPIPCLSPTLCLLSSLLLILTVFHFSLISSFGSPTAAAGKVLCLAQSFSSSFPSALSASVLLITPSFSIHPSLITADMCTFHHETTPLQTYKPYINPHHVSAGSQCCKATLYAHGRFNKK